MKMKKFFGLGVLLMAIPVIGCGPQLVTEMKRAGLTANNDYYAIMGAVNNERGPATTAVTIVAEPRNASYQRTTITNVGGQLQTAPANKAWEPPKTSPRGKKALICKPTLPSPPPAPVKPTQTIIETVKSPELQVVGGAGGTGPSTLQSWGAALLSSAPIAGGMIGGAALLRPARTNVTQTGGGAGATAAGGVGVGYGGAGGAGGSASSSSSSSAASSASAAAAAAAD